MSNQRVDVYVADLSMWNGIGPLGQVGYADKPPIPRSRQDTDLATPTISVGTPWSQTIGAIISSLNSGQQIAKLYMMGHGSAGQFTMGKTLAYTDDTSIAEFQRLRPYCQIWLTNVYIIGCEVAADGPCVVLPTPVFYEGKVQTMNLCRGQFSGNTKMPGYTLLRKLADAVNAPVHGSTWKLPISRTWDDQLAPARLTVGPGGGWVYSEYNTRTRFGSP